MDARSMCGRLRMALESSPWQMRAAGKSTVSRNLTAYMSVGFSSTSLGVLAPKYPLQWWACFLSGPAANQLGPIDVNYHSFKPCKGAGWLPCACMRLHAERACSAGWGIPAACHDQMVAVQAFHIGADVINPGLQHTLCLRKSTAIRRLLCGGLAASFGASPSGACQHVCTAAHYGSVGHAALAAEP